MPISDFVFLAEDPTHDGAIRLINEEAFGPGRFVRAAERVREQGPHDRALSFVCLDGEDLVGSVRMTPIAAGAASGYLLGPLAVRPSHKNRGIGRELVRIALAAAEAAGGEAVVLIGDPPYYRPLGFQPVPVGALALPGPVDPARILAVPFGKAAMERFSGMLRHRDRG